MTTPRPTDGDLFNPYGRLVAAYRATHHAYVRALERHEQAAEALASAALGSLPDDAAVPPIVAQVARRRAELAAVRRVLNARRRAGLALRHAAKLQTPRP